MDGITNELGQELERNYVKSTYDNIAEDFSNTRYKKWPKVELFLKGTPSGSLLLDVGCGNGKYLDNPKTFNIGCDLSLNLLRICKSRKFDVVLCDMCRLPFREEAFDTIICIASLHHIATEQRRQRCLEDITNLLDSSTGKILTQVWSYEQNHLDNPYLKRNKTVTVNESESQVVINETVTLPIHINRTPFTNQDVLVPFKTKSSPTECEAATSSVACSQQKQLRYYHVFKDQELDKMFEKIENVNVEDSYHDKGNWCIIASAKSKYPAS